MSFTVADIDAEVIKASLAVNGINVSAAKPSSALLDATARQLPTVVRASPHYYNTDQELARLVDGINAIARKIDTAGAR